MITDIASKRSIWVRLSNLREAPSRSYGLPGRAATHYVGACRRLCMTNAGQNQQSDKATSRRNVMIGGLVAVPTLASFPPTPVGAGRQNPATPSPPPPFAPQFGI